MKSLLVVTETELTDIDLENIVGVAATEGESLTHIDLMVSYDLPEPLVAQVINNLALFRFSEAAESARGGKSSYTQRDEAEAIAGQAQKALESKAFTVTTTVQAGDPLEAIKNLVAETDPVQAVFITRFYPLEDSLNILWTNKARDLLGIPVLHFHTGSTRIED